MKAVSFLNEEKLIGDNNRIFSVSEPMKVLLLRWKNNTLSLDEEKQFIDLLGMAYYTGAIEAAERYDAHVELLKQKGT